MRDPGVLPALDALERYARTFDEISDEQDTRYSAQSLVRWVRARGHCSPGHRAQPIQGEDGRSKPPSLVLPVAKPLPSCLV